MHERGSSGPAGRGEALEGQWHSENLRLPEQLFGLSGRRAVVTGASSGIGRRAALVLATAGARVLAVARRGERLQALATAQPQLAERLLPLPLDLSLPGAVERLAGQAMAGLGGCDILVAAAGIPGRMAAAAVEAPGFDQVLHLNVTVQAQLAAALFPALRASDAGRVIHVASIYGLRGQESGSLAPYIASKHALVGLTRSQAIEWAGEGITVNALAPGHFPTEMTETLLADSTVAPRLQQRYPIGRFGRLEELDTALLFLAAPASSFVTGIVLPVDGGWTSR
jgi:gluconate 5-dehydrogenase